MLWAVEPLALLCAEKAGPRDFAPSARGNGLWAVLVVVERCVLQITQVAARCNETRESLLFDSQAVQDELGYWSDVLLDRTVRRILVIAIELADATSDPEMFASETESRAVLEQVDAIDGSVFFGNSLGLQFPPDLQQILVGISAAMAGYFAGHAGVEPPSTGSQLTSAMVAGLCMIDGEQRSARLTSAHGGPDGCDPKVLQAFWSLSETAIVKAVSDTVLSSSCEVQREILIPVTTIVVDGTSYRAGEITANTLSPSDGALDLTLPPGETTSTVGEIDRTSTYLGDINITKRTANGLGTLDGSADPVATEVDCAGSLLVAPEGTSALVATRLTGLVMDQRAQQTLDAPCHTASPVRSDSSPVSPSGWGTWDALGAGGAGELGSEKRLNPVTATWKTLYAKIGRFAPTGWQDTSVAVEPESTSTERNELGREAASELDDDTFDDISESEMKDIPQFDAVKVTVFSRRARGGAAATSNAAKITPDTSTLSNGLVLHFHGGGFVSSTSRTHEVYLRKWAIELDSPVVSVDYSLAPQHPYPRALNECFFVYLWCRANSARVGWNGGRVCFTGDSAGGNLAVAVALRCVMTGAPPPDGLVLCYPVLNVGQRMSVSRLMSMLDPLLPQGVLIGCLRAYVPASPHIDQSQLTVGASGESDDNGGIGSDPLMSPLWASERLLGALPPVHIGAVLLDPLLDDSVAFAKKLRAVGGVVQLHVFPDLCHGFLMLSAVHKPSAEASQLCIDWIHEVLNCEDVQTLLS